MEFANLDMIVKRSLLENGKPIHWYPEYLFHASACLRELSFDTLKLVNTKRLPVNDYGAVDLPSDYSDFISVGIELGGTISKIPQQEWISPLRVHNTSGQFVAQSTDDIDLAARSFFAGYYGNWSWYWNITDGYGEPTGRFYGSNGGTEQGFKIVKERRQIQLTDNFKGGGIVLMYISNGQSIDNATQIDWAAFSTIQAYIGWKSSRNANIKNSQEATSFYHEKKLLRARLSNLTMIDIKQVLHSSYRASIKN